jgi:His/Glu/Gln/Arg/opine family amino acid ABC transporter permease subunit
VTALIRLAVTFALVLSICAVSAAQTAPIPPKGKLLRWAGDAEGGAPYVEADPADPSRVVGFDVDIAELLARGLGRSPEFVEITFASIDQSIGRGDADIGLSGIEDTPTHRAAFATTVPYYQFREVLSVRNGDYAQFRALDDLRGRRVGTLVGTIAYDILLKAERDHGIVAVSYEDDVHPYSDLIIGRLDAVLLDNVLAERRRRTTSGFVTHADPVAVSHYIGLMAPQNASLRNQVNDLLKQAMRDGRLEAIFRKWKVWNDDQPALFAQVLNGTPIPPVIGFQGYEIDSGTSLSKWDATKRYLPSLVRASGVTLVFSCASMLLAVALGVAIATGRLYGDRVSRALLTGYVELIRGTPILLQLFVLYYGLAAAIRLPAWMAALLGLALNYAAYESEIYRGALLAVPVGQLEAAKTLGFTSLQTLRLIRGPQAFRLALAPMTNDFVALLKDSSLVSVLTVVELTKQTQILATNLGSWVIPGALCAALYLAMSLPIAAVARMLEGRWRSATV